MTFFFSNCHLKACAYGFHKIKDFNFQTTSVCFQTTLLCFQIGPSSSYSYTMVEIYKYLNFSMYFHFSHFIGLTSRIPINWIIVYYELKYWSSCKLGTPLRAALQTYREEVLWSKELKAWIRVEAWKQPVWANRWQCGTCCDDKFKNFPPYTLINECFLLSSTLQMPNPSKNFLIDI